MCRVLEVSRSGYYAWRGRRPAATAQRQVDLTERIRQVHAASRQVYGAPRASRVAGGRRALCAWHGGQADAQSRDSLEDAAAVRGPHHRQPTRSSDRTELAESPVSAAPAQPGLGGDITYIPTAEGWLYLAAVLDLYSRKIVGWATERFADSRAVLPGLATWRSASAGRVRALLHHTDRGVQYASDEYQQLLSAARHRAAA